MGFIKKHLESILMIIFCLIMWRVLSDNFFLVLAGMLACLSFVIVPESNKLEKRIEKLEGKKNV